MMGQIPFKTTLNTVVVDTNDTALCPVQPPRPANKGAEVVAGKEPKMFNDHNPILGCWSSLSVRQKERRNPSHFYLFFGPFGSVCRRFVVRNTFWVLIPLGWLDCINCESICPSLNFTNRRRGGRPESRGVRPFVKHHLCYFLAKMFVLLHLPQSRRPHEESKQILLNESNRHKYS